MEYRNLGASGLEVSPADHQLDDSLEAVTVVVTGEEAARIDEQVPPGTSVL